MKQQNIMETKLARIAEISRERPKEVFTSIYHFLNKDLLMLCHKELDGKKATGLDGVTKAEYEENLEENIEQLEKELQNMRYKPSPAKRVYILKANFKKIKPNNRGKQNKLCCRCRYQWIFRPCRLELANKMCRTTYKRPKNNKTNKKISKGRNN